MWVKKLVDSPEELSSKPHYIRGQNAATAYAQQPNFAPLPRHSMAGAGR